MLVDCHGGRRRRYWCAARDSLVRAMEDYLRKLGRTGEEPLPVERVGTWEVIVLPAAAAAATDGNFPPLFCIYVFFVCTNYPVLC